MDTYLKTLEEERDYYKGETDVLNKLLKSHNMSRTVSRDLSPKRSSRAASPSRTPSKADKKVSIHCF